MKKTVILLLLTSFSLSAQTAVSPATKIEISAFTPIKPVNAHSYVSSMKIKEVERLLGRKMSLKEKLTFKVFQWKTKKGYQPYKNSEYQGKGQTALTLGIISIVSMFIPYISIAALPCAILAIISGTKAKKVDPDDRRAKTGVVLGWITIGVLVLAIIAVAVIISSGGLVM